MLIEKLYVENIRGIRELTIEFHDGLNLICGMNGVGKTTILDTIVSTFAYNPRDIKRNARATRGNWEVSMGDNVFQVSIDAFKPNDMIENGLVRNLAEISKKIIYIKDQRPLSYKELGSLQRDPNPTYMQRGDRVAKGIEGDDLKNWFILRAFSHPQGRFTEAETNNFELAKKAFSLLDASVTYSHVKHETFEIMVDSSRGEIYFEYLSSGFKSCLFIVLGIIKEIEYNFKDTKLAAKDFDGLILIDEADAHLHPHWQRKFLGVLKESFPQAQFIVTTHSPHMIQETNSNEIIALGINEEDGEVYKLDLIESDYGFKGWTVEEILEDVMGIKNTFSDEYNEIKRQFEHAIDTENIYEARRAYKELNKMLHPKNPVRKIYELQFNTLGDLE